MTTTITRADDLLRDSVRRQLAWAPEVDASMVGVAAQDGVVTLSGYVDTYAAKLAAERVSRNVFGVTAIADELEVRLPHERIDPEIARDAVEVLKSHDLSAAVGVTVRAGHVTLTGSLESVCQSVAAERAVKHLRGVRGVFNHIAITAHVSPINVQQLITEALRRHAEVEAPHRGGR